MLHVLRKFIPCRMAPLDAISFQRCMAFLDAGARESLSDVVSKVLRKVLSQPEGKIEELDDTLLT